MHEPIMLFHMNQLCFLMLTSHESIILSCLNLVLGPLHNMNMSVRTVAHNHGLNPPLW